MVCGTVNDVSECCVTRVRCTHVLPDVNPYLATLSSRYMHEKLCGHMLDVRCTSAAAYRLYVVDIRYARVLLPD